MFLGVRSEEGGMLRQTLRVLVSNLLLMLPAQWSPFPGAAACRKRIPHTSLPSSPSLIVLCRAGPFPRPSIFEFCVWRRLWRDISLCISFALYAKAILGRESWVSNAHLHLGHCCLGCGGIFLSPSHFLPCGERPGPSLGLISLSLQEGWEGAGSG